MIRSSAIPIAAVCTFAACAPPDGAATFRDGARIVLVERTGPAVLDEAGRPLAPVRLHYEGRDAVFHAYVDRTAIVQLDADTDATELERAGVRVLRPLMPSIGLWLVEDARGGDGIDAAARLADPAGRVGGVVEAIPNLYVTLRTFTDFTPNDPRFGGQWYFDTLRMPEAWGLTKGDASQTIVIVDTGCDLRHADLAAKLDPGLDLVDDDEDPTFDPSEAGAAHGTACAGIAAAATDNGEGIAGACPECRLMCVRLITDVAQPLSKTVDAFEHALAVDAAVVSNSWGFAEPLPVPASVAAAVTNVYATGRGGKGALVFFAAGNDDREILDDELQAVEGVLAIGAINHFDEQTPFTNYGAAIDLVAPTGTLTTDITGPVGDDPTDYTSTFGGTSSACPVAAGIGGLLVGAAPERTSAELYEVLIQSARPAPYAVPDDSGHDPVYGYGIVDPVAALQLVLGGGGGGGGASGAGAEGGGHATPGPAADAASDESSCSCALPGLPGRDASAATILLAIAALARRRRR